MTGEHCSSTSYRRWARHLGPDIELSLVEYPGHGTRMGEPLVEDHRVLVEEAATEIAPADVPIALLGHRTWTDEDLAAELVGYRGTPAEFMRDPATQDMLIRILRCDYGLLDRYVCDADQRLSMGVTAFYRIDDDYVSEQDILRWLVRALSGDVGIRESTTILTIHGTTT